MDTITDVPLTMGMVLYPGFTLLDLVGPQGVLGLHAKTLLLSKTRDAVQTETGLAIHPTTTFDECPEYLDILFVPGGYGTNEAMKDEKIVSFLARAGRSAGYVTSVCSGSILLGMAGLLDGYKAATHWACYGSLAASGAIPVHERVVIDRNRVSGGGVTAGIDFGLTLLAELRGERVAKTTQLVIEYDPQPPFRAGNPRSAGPEIVEAAMGLLGDMDEQMKTTLRSRILKSVQAA
ncbi:DJ-1/PfpI family protein [Polymorphobacter megasporae]|uniref:DJ-1/PfpI family protein n=1 Tax=Glacieibacterium megasporae TaxID=2835787 RepID=UPI001C1E6FDF|nr:DJ-1/PfpI family protein [Polymorphobacter megasporae]UAJ10618.1 DJ-1/PfpI family protein [Polymorphobacter megasporae]